ncbi:zinc finger protein 845-like [Homarus americanus]|uniref:zinc finger protein 845-like n=1 Tax=Homarus americanus TaxID=6706 RepID=UPI001C484D0C|nr:zinc finger protein 845-like [Homarus americanus]XP_042238401.1 zinc finger protein 845-like [Homarus americanus]
MNVNLYWEHSVKCEFCEATFDNQDTLKQHLRLHSRRKPYKCDECGAKFSYNSTLEWHKKSHTGEMPFKCDECGAQFLQNSMLVWHKRKHRMGESSQNSALVVNMANIYHQQNVPTFPNFFSLPSLVNTANTVPANVVATCSTGPISSIAAPSHLHLTNCLSPQPLVATNSSQQEMQTDATGKRKLEIEEGTFRCDICGTVLLHSSDLRAHMHTKHNMGENNPFHILARQQQVNGEFIRKKIIVEKPYKCDLCGAGFNTEGHLKSHRQKHIVERPYKCEKCCLTFSDKSILESHERRHQAERPHKCDRCGAAFFRETHLQRHIKRHTGELV